MLADSHLVPAAYPDPTLIDASDPWTTARETDQKVRLAAFEFLRRETELRGEVLPRELLAEGFRFEGQRVPLVGPQGIFQPRVLPQMPLSITTVPVVAGKARPYEDDVDEGGLLLYRYRGTDPNHRDNLGLRLAMRRQAPLVYFYGVVPGEYLTIWPVFIVGDDPAHLTFTVAVDLPERASGEAGSELSEGAVLTPAVEARRTYVTREVRMRLHQQSFRMRVIRAYRERCAVCRLRHEELLDAAHILPDRHPLGEPVIPNGLALCKLHHAAFDRNFLGIRPDYRVEIREDLMLEHDGPMLQHGLREFHRRELLVLPRLEDLRPNRDFLAERYEIFRKAG